MLNFSQTAKNEAKATLRLGVNKVDSITLLKNGVKVVCDNRLRIYPDGYLSIDQYYSLLKKCEMVGTFQVFVNHFEKQGVSCDYMQDLD